MRLSTSGVDLDRPESRRGSYLTVRREAGIGVHIGDDDLRKLLRHSPAGGPVVIDDGEVVEKLVAKACLLSNCQRAADGIGDLHVATDCVQQAKGVFEALLEHCARVG